MSRVRKVYRLKTEAGIVMLIKLSRQSNIIYYQTVMFKKLVVYIADLIYVELGTIMRQPYGQFISLIVREQYIFNL